MTGVSNHFLPNIGGGNYGGMVGNGFGVNRHQSNLSKQNQNMGVRTSPYIRNGNNLGGLPNGGTNFLMQNKLYQQGAKLQKQNQAIKLQKQNQRLQQAITLQKQQQQLIDNKRKQLITQQNTYRKSDANKNSYGNSMSSNYQLDEYDQDYYDFG